LIDPQQINQRARVCKESCKASQNRNLASDEDPRSFVIRDPRTHHISRIPRSIASHDPLNTNMRDEGYIVLNDDEDDQVVEQTAPRGTTARGKSTASTSSSRTSTRRSAPYRIPERTNTNINTNTNTDTDTNTNSPPITYTQAIQNMQSHLVEDMSVLQLPDLPEPPIDPLQQQYGWIVLPFGVHGVAFDTLQLQNIHLARLVVHLRQMNIPPSRTMTNETPKVSTIPLNQHGLLTEILQSQHVHILRILHQCRELFEPMQELGREYSFKGLS